MAFPNLVWEPVTTYNYSFAAGFEGDKMRMIFDIFNFKEMTAPRLIALVEKGDSPCSEDDWEYAFSPREMLQAAEIPDLN